MRTIASILSYVFLAVFAFLVLYWAIDKEGKILGTTDNIYAFCIGLVGWVAGAFVWSLWRDNTKEWDEYDQEYRLGDLQLLFREFSFPLAIILIFVAAIIVENALIPFSGIPETKTIIALIAILVSAALLVFLLTKDWAFPGTLVVKEVSDMTKRADEQTEAASKEIVFLRQKMHVIVKLDGSILTEDQINEELRNFIDAANFSKEELYAEAVNLLLGSPDELKDQCPIFWDTWEKALESHPDVGTVYRSLRANLRKA